MKSPLISEKHRFDNHHFRQLGCNYLDWQWTERRRGNATASGERLWRKSSRSYAMLMELFYRTRLQRRHLAQLDEPREGRPELLAITDQRAVPMPLVQPTDAAAVSNPAQQQRP